MRRWVFAFADHWSQNAVQLRVPIWLPLASLCAESDCSDARSILFWDQCCRDPLGPHTHTHHYHPHVQSLLATVFRPTSYKSSKNLSFFFNCWGRKKFDIILRRMLFTCEFTIDFSKHKFISLPHLWQFRALLAQVLSYQKTFNL